MSDKPKKVLSPEHLEKMRQGRIRKAEERKAQKEASKADEKAAKAEAKAAEKARAAEAKAMVSDQKRVLLANQKALAKKKMREEVERLKGQVHESTELVHFDDNYEIRVIADPEASAAAAEPEPAPKPARAPTPDPTPPPPLAEETNKLQGELNALRAKLNEKSQAEAYGTYRKMCDKVALNIKPEERGRFYQLTSVYDHSLTPQENVKKLQVQVTAADAAAKKRVFAETQAKDAAAAAEKAAADKHARMKRVFSLY
jgi:colicin import membrane protein